MSEPIYIAHHLRAITVTWRFPDGRVRSATGATNSLPLQLDPRDPTRVMGLSRPLQDAGAVLVSIVDAEPFVGLRGPVGLRPGEVYDGPSEPAEPSFAVQKLAAEAEADRQATKAARRKAAQKAHVEAVAEVELDAHRERIAEYVAGVVE